MFLGYVGAIAGGIGLAAILLVISKTLRLNLPRWLYPATAGLGMLLLTIHIEYSWFSQVRSTLPEEIEIVETFDYSVPYQPWTYLIPRVNRFVAIDHTSARTNDGVEDLVLIDVILMERFSPTFKATNFVNCDAGERLLVGDDIEMDETGMPLSSDWSAVGLDDPLIKAVCERHNSPSA
ncbi:MAG: hypothetical protein ACFB01_04860 [Cohaesibacteraceae bacterium]